jgi:hypothetical protein
MKARSRFAGTLAALALAACDGPKANVPAVTGTSKVSAQLSGGKKPVTVSGPAFAVTITAEASGATPKTKKFLVYVFAADTKPAPSCELLARYGALAGLERGGFLAFTMNKIASGPGKVDVEELGAILMDPVTHEMSLLGEDAANMSITLTALDASSFAGVVTTGAGAATSASGPIAGTVCPAFTTPGPR